MASLSLTAISEHGMRQQELSCSTLDRVTFREAKPVRVTRDLNRTVDFIDAGADPAASSGRNIMQEPAGNELELADVVEGEDTWALTQGRTLKCPVGRVR